MMASTATKIRSYGYAEHYAYQTAQKNFQENNTFLSLRMQRSSIHLLMKTFSKMFAYSLSDTSSYIISNDFEKPLFLLTARTEQAPFMCCWRKKRRGRTSHTYNLYAATYIYIAAYEKMDLLMR